MLQSWLLGSPGWKSKDWAPQHSHARGQLFALTQGLLIVETTGGRCMFPSQRCAWIPPGLLTQGTLSGKGGRLDALLLRGAKSVPKN